jgi:hypothetical protein
MEMDWPTLSAIVATASGIATVAWRKLRVAIKYVYSEVTAKIDGLEKKVEKCETDRATMHEKMDEMGRDLDMFKGCPKEPCGAREAFHRRASFSVKSP